MQSAGGPQAFSERQEQPMVAMLPQHWGEKTETASRDRERELSQIEAGVAFRQRETVHQLANNKGRHLRDQSADHLRGDHADHEVRRIVRRLWITRGFNHDSAARKTHTRALGP